VIAAIYARKSTEQTGVSDEEKSVGRQIEHAKAYALKKGWTSSEEHVFVDDGISGAEFVKRPGIHPPDECPQASPLLPHPHHERRVTAGP
jgi:DNA invertase Pin-like site-specific DNA recombinase